VAFAVEDVFQGKGIGAHLLERLALLAVRNGFMRFMATTQSSNEPMLELFRSSGFKVHEKREGGFVQVDFSVIPTKESFDRSEMLDRVVTAASLRPFFKPKSVAVVGASREPGSLGYQIVHNLVNTGFKGEVYPINPHADLIDNVRAYHEIGKVPVPVDLAIIVVPARYVLEVVEDCALHGVRAVVVITAGFAEVSPAGIDIQKKLVEIVRAHGMRLIGPNCMGLMNTDPDVRLNASFSFVYPPHGRIAMSSQSGALGLAVLEFAEQKSLGLSTFVSVGNKADVSGNDLLQYWEEDPGTDVILLYLESFGNPRRFARIARRVSRSKPIVAVKSGRTKAGSRAAGSHTAAMMASDTAVEALFQQTGVIRANALEEMFDLAFALGSQPLPKGRRVGIITNAGGPGILCADTCEAKQLIVGEFSESTRARLEEFLPPAASTANPVDMIASATPDQYRKTVELLLKAPEVDSLIIIYVPVIRNLDPVLEAIRHGVGAARQDGGKEKPVFACFMTEKGNTRIELPKESIPTYLFPESAAHVLAKVARYAEWKKQPPGFMPDFEDMHLEQARQV
ncbi:MAG TPA: GNAT family N-acetyltransferase, partial [Acidobacteriota bacterium]